MPKMRIAAPANTSHRVCVNTDSAITGSPHAATSGHHDPPGMWIGAGGVAGGSRMASWCSVFQRGSRLVTVGMTEKLYAGGGEGMLHSSVAPPQGPVGAARPGRALCHTSRRDTSIETAMRKAPTTEARISPEQPTTGE